MLILTRRIGEAIIIGDNIAIHIMGIRGLQVRIGIDAPRDISVHRQEIYQRILEEKESAENVKKYSEGIIEAPTCAYCFTLLNPGDNVCPACKKSFS